MTDRLVTPDEVASLIGNIDASDANLVRLTDAVCAEAVRYCARKFFYGTDRVEICRGYGDDRIFLSDSPIAQLTEVRVDANRVFGDDTIVTISQFMVSAGYDDPRIWWPGNLFPDGNGVVQVKWSGGYYPTADSDPLHVPKVPEDLRAALIDEIVARVNRGGAEVLKTESIGSYSYERFDGRFSPSSKAVLESYRFRSA